MRNCKSIKILLSVARFLCNIQTAYCILIIVHCYCTVVRHNLSTVIDMQWRWVAGRRVCV